MATTGMHGICGFLFQSAHEDNKLYNTPDYANPTLYECQAVHDKAYESQLAVSMILIPDQSIYRKLIEDL